MDNQWEVVDNEWEVVPPTVAQPKKRLTAGQVATGALQNIIPSTGRLVGETVSAVVHPIDTISNVLDLGVGEMRKVLPKSVVNAIDKADLALGYKEGYGKQEKMANALNNMYKQRYGTEEGLKETIANDPAAILADVSAVLAGGAGVAGKTSKLGKLLSESSDVANPLTAAGKVVTKPISMAGSATKGILGRTTGVGSEAVNQAVLAGETGNEVFTQNLRKASNMEDAVKIAQTGLENMRQKKNEAYRSGMVDVSDDKSVLDFGDVDTAIANAKTKNYSHGEFRDVDAQAALDKVERLVNKWKSKPPEDRTPEGLDFLKQKINNEILSKLDYQKDAFARNLVGDVYNELKSTITKQAPTYAEVMQNYGKASEQIDEIKRALSLNKKASADTALKKLQSILREDVSSSFGHRKQLAQQLIDSGAQDLMPALAGQALSTWRPRGILGDIETGAAGLYALTNPIGALTKIPFIMPRSVGEMAYAYGKGKGAAKKLAGKSPVTKSQAKKLGLLLQQANQGNQGEE